MKAQLRKVRELAPSPRQVRDGNLGTRDWGTLPWETSVHCPELDLLSQLPAEDLPLPLDPFYKPLSLLTNLVALF